MPQSNYKTGLYDLRDWIESSFTPIVGVHRVGEFRLRTGDPGPDDAERAVEAGIIPEGLARRYGILPAPAGDVPVSTKGRFLSQEGAVSASANDEVPGPSDGYEGGSARVVFNGSLAAVSSAATDLDGGLSVAPADLTIQGNVGVTWSSASGSGTLTIQVGTETAAFSVVGTGSGQGASALTGSVSLSAGDTFTFQAYTSGITVNDLAVSVFGTLT